MSRINIADKETLDKVHDLLKGKVKRYGYRRKIIEGQPAGRIEYLFDAVGMTPAAMNFSTGVFNYGSWADLWFIKDNYPCMLQYNGVEGYKLNKNDHTKKIDGSASDVANTDYGGNAMSAIPLCWVNRYEENGYHYFIVCQTKYDDEYEAYAHTDRNGKVKTYFYYPMYKGSEISSKLRSLSGQRPMNGKTAPQELTLAQANGTGWSEREFLKDQLLCDLITLITKSDNDQETIGRGHDSGGSSAADLLTTGSLNTAGQFYGYNDGSHQMKAFYIEGFYADRWDRLLGEVCVNGTYMVKPDATGNGFNFTGEGYEAIGPASPDNGWQRETQMTKYGMVPKTVGGSESTFMCVYYWLNRDIVAVPIVGGDCSNGRNCGSRCVDCSDAASCAAWSLGASPSYT